MKVSKPQLMKMKLKTVIKKVAFPIIFVIIGMLIPFIILKSERKHYIVIDQTDIIVTLQKEETERTIAFLDSMKVQYKLFVEIPTKYEQRIFNFLETTQDTIRELQ